MFLHVAEIAEVSIGDVIHNFRFAFVGIKGDWPFLRKAAGLATSFNWRAKRMCHLCDGRAAQI